MDSQFSRKRMAKPPKTVSAPVSNAISEKSPAEARSESTFSDNSMLNSIGDIPERKSEDGDEELGLTNSRENPVSGDVADADPFGVESEGGVKYKTLKWWNAGFLLIAETVSLGILSLPKADSTMGFFPGVFLNVMIGLLATYTGIVIGKFKQKHMGVHSFADAAKLLFGPIGYWLFFVAQLCILVFIMAAHILTFSVMMNRLTEHGTCTIVFTVIGTIISFLLSLPRTSKTQSHFSVASCLSITVAIIFTMIVIGITKPGVGNTSAITPASMTTWQEGAMSVSNIVVAYAGHVAFFGFISELEKPEDFPKALALLQTVAISFYVTVAVVIYYFAGQAVKSPALNSAGPLFSKISYGLAIPTIVIAGVVNAHIAVKQIYVKMWRGKHSIDSEGREVSVMSEKSFRARGSWYLLGLLCWVAAWILASAIPVFGELLGILGAVLCSWFTLGMPAIFWLWMNREVRFRDWKQGLQTMLNILILLVCIGVCVTGIWGSAWAISKNTGSHSPFSCADNSID